jgi:hypothetical protein
VRSLSHQSNGNEKQKSQSVVNNSQGAGTEYHKEHAGNVEGYGQPHPVNGEGNMTRNNE